MSPLLEKILAEIAQLSHQDRLQVMAHLLEGEAQVPEASVPTTMTRKQLFGCLRGKIKMADDFNEPLDDFSEYM